MSFSFTERLDAVVTRGLVGVGQAHRVAVVVELARTLSDGDQPSAISAVSGEELARDLGLSRAAVHKHIEHLRSLGFAVVPLAGKGYRLERSHADLTVAEAVLPCLLDVAPLEAPWVAGLPYRYCPACVSTNAELKSLATAEPTGAVVVADGQSGGRGRLGRMWASEPGKDLTFSVLLRPELGPAQAHLLSLAAALAVAEVLEDIPRLRSRVGVKWPNDVLLDGEKVCGILLEGSMDADRLQWVVAGVGLNVNSEPAVLLESLGRGRQAEWHNKPKPTSLRAKLGEDLPRAPLLAGLLTALTRRWARVDPDTLVSELRRLDVLAGQPVEVLSGLRQDEAVVAGKAAGIGQEGQLLVRVASGDIVPVFAGDVTVRRPRPAGW